MLTFLLVLRWCLVLLFALSLDDAACDVQTFKPAAQRLAAVLEVTLFGNGCIFI